MLQPAQRALPGADSFDGLPLRLGVSRLQHAFLPYLAGCPEESDAACSCFGGRLGLYVHTVKIAKPMKLYRGSGKMPR